MVCFDTSNAPQLFAITEIRERKGVVIRPVFAKNKCFLYGSGSFCDLWPLYVIDSVVLHVIYCYQCSKPSITSVISDVNVGYDVYYGVYVCVREYSNADGRWSESCNGTNGYLLDVNGVFR